MGPIAITPEVEAEARAHALKRERWSEGVRLKALLAEIDALRERLQKAEAALEDSPGYGTQQ
jgi:hypothetical protein